MNNKGVSLMELVLSLVLSAVVLLVLMAIYNYQTSFFSGNLSSQIMQREGALILGTFKKYTSMADNVELVSSNEVILGFPKSGERFKVWWRVLPGGELSFVILRSEDTTPLSEVILSNKISVSETTFSYEYINATKIGLLDVKLAMEDEYGNKVKRFTKFRIKF